MSWHLQDGQWLLTMPRPETRDALARAVRVDPAEITYAAWRSLLAHEDEDPEDEQRDGPVARGGQDDDVLPLHGMTAEQRRQIREYAEFITRQNPHSQ